MNKADIKTQNRTAIHRPETSKFCRLIVGLAILAAIVLLIWGCPFVIDRNASGQWALQIQQDKAEAFRTWFRGQLGIMDDSAPGGMTGSFGDVPDPSKPQAPGFMGGF